MRADLPCCSFKNCRYCFDGNCRNPIEYEICEFREQQKIVELFHSYRHICGDTPPERLRELVEADRIVGQKLWLTKWFTHGVRIANPPIPRNVIFFSRLKNGEILLHLKDGAFPPRLIGDCAYKTYEEAKAALKGENDG